MFIKKTWCTTSNNNFQLKFSTKAICFVDNPEDGSQWLMFTTASDGNLRAWSIDKEDVRITNVLCNPFIFYCIVNRKINNMQLFPIKFSNQITLLFLVVVRERAQTVGSPWYAWKTNLYDNKGSSRIKEATRKVWRSYSWERTYRQPKSKWKVSQEEKH